MQIKHAQAEMIEVDGKLHKTIEEAAGELKVHPKTLRSYISKGIVPKPPAIASGLVYRSYFPAELLQEYLKIIEGYRDARRK